MKCLIVQWNLDRTKGQGTGKICSLYRSSFPYILLLLGKMIPFVTPRTSLNRGSLNRGSTQDKVKDYDEDVFDLDIKIPQDC